MRGFDSMTFLFLEGSKVLMSVVFGEEASPPCA